MTRILPARSGTTRQLVVLCHGVGSNADDLIGLAPHWAAFAPNATFVSPDGPEAYDMAPPGSGRQWFSLLDRDPAAMAAGARRAQGRLDAMIDGELARLGLPGDAYALMGFSQGAMMVLFAGLRRAHPPAAILAYSGGLLAPESLATEQTGAPPVLIVHGMDDPVVPVAWSRATADTLEARGVSVTRLFVPGMGHSIDESGMLAGGRALRRAFP
jgi:phospholipase/carboxylesterase